MSLMPELSRIVNASDNVSNNEPLSPQAEILKYKHLLAAMTEKVNQKEASIKQKRVTFPSGLGRGICKIVSLYGSLQEITLNSDLHELSIAGDGDDGDESFYFGLTYHVLFYSTRDKSSGGDSLGSGVTDTH
ncbi:hypothetical protein BDQ17DRAFT_1329358 [Cyathus striatus]|nr:hypothetical protein BDQ17DRAFT_1329358 [Cyathus striatus]